MADPGAKVGQTRGLLPVSPDILHDELDGAHKIVGKWLSLLDQGLPYLDKPGSEEDLNVLLREMVGELLLSSSKLESVARLVNGDTG